MAQRRLYATQISALPTSTDVSRLTRTIKALKPPTQTSIPLPSAEDVNRRQHDLQERRQERKRECTRKWMREN